MTVVMGCDGCDAMGAQYPLLGANRLTETIGLFWCRIVRVNEV